MTSQSLSRDCLTQPVEDAVVETRPLVEELLQVVLHSYGGAVPHPPGPADQPLVDEHCHPDAPMTTHV